MWNRSRHSFPTPAPAIKGGSGSTTLIAMIRDWMGGKWVRCWMVFPDSSWSSLSSSPVLSSPSGVGLGPTRTGNLRQPNNKVERAGRIRMTYETTRTVIQFWILLFRIFLFLMIIRKENNPDPAKWCSFTPLTLKFLKWMLVAYLPRNISDLQELPRVCAQQPLPAVADPAQPGPSSHPAQNCGF